MFSFLILHNYIFFKYLHLKIFIWFLRSLICIGLNTLYMTSLILYINDLKKNRYSIIKHKDEFRIVKHSLFFN